MTSMAATMMSTLQLEENIERVLDTTKPLRTPPFFGLLVPPARFKAMADAAAGTKKKRDPYAGRWACWLCTAANPSNATQCRLCKPQLSVLFP